MRRAGRKIVLLLLAVVLFSGFCSCTEERKEEVETLRTVSYTHLADFVLNGQRDGASV